MGQDDHAMPNPQGPTRDRRTYPRQAHLASLLRIHTAHPAGQGTVCVDGDIANLSRGGALVSSEHRINPGQPCLIEMIGANPFRLERCTGTVRRTSIGSRYDFLLAIEFKRPI